MAVDDEDDPEDGEDADIYNCPMRCCIFSFTVWYALMIVCSLIMISVVSALGLLTLEAIVIESVSTMILHTHVLK